MKSEDQIREQRKEQEHETKDHCDASTTKRKKGETILER
jgi:hypothetical protein